MSHTRRIRLSASAPQPEAIAAAAACIRAGGLVAFPTETVYGLGANAWSSKAVEKIFRAKGRPPSDPLIAHIASLQQLPELARDIPAIAYQLAERYFPGPLTLVLAKAERVPSKLSAGLDTVALRMPQHPVALALLRQAQVPIAAPSANRFAGPSPTRAQHVLDDLDGAVDIVLDAGSCAIGVESTILSLVDSPPQLLRPGGLALEELRRIVPDLRYAPRYLEVDDTVPAPGSLRKHYAPRARVLLFSGEEYAVQAAMRKAVLQHESAGILASDADLRALSDLPVPTARLGANAEEAALRLFAALRALDRQGVQHIVTRMPPNHGLGLALGDRLLRAADGVLVHV